MNLVLVIVSFALLWLLWAVLERILDAITRHQHSLVPGRDTAHGMGPWKQDEGTADDGAFVVYDQPSH